MGFSAAAAAFATNSDGTKQTPNNDDQYVALVWRNVRGDDPYGYALGFNVHRRHLTPEQRRELIASVLKAKPEASNRQIAKQVKADDKTVASVRADMEGRAEIPHVEKRTDSKGRQQPSTKTTAKINGKTTDLTQFSPEAQQAIAAAQTEVVPDEAEREGQVQFINEHISCAIESAVTVQSVWSRIERRDCELADDVRDDVVAEIRALIAEWERALGAVMPALKAKDAAV